MRYSEETEFLKIAGTQQEYLSQWYLESPAIITSHRYNELYKVQQLLYKAICYFIDHFDKFKLIFPLSDQIRKIVDICRPYPYRIGTYRPDFLINKEGQLKICEIGARFPLNGYFMSGIAEYIGLERYSYSSYLAGPSYGSFLRYLSAYWGDMDTLYVLKGSDRPCDIKLYVPYFEARGVKVCILTPEQLSGENLQKLNGGCVVNEFNQMEMDRLDEKALRAIAASHALNDMRTIYLIHDKRFLAVLSDTGFLSEFLNAEEIAFLQPYLIPTYTFLQAPEIWEHARNERENWVIKHTLLGKSEQVYTGRTCSREEWERLCDGPVNASMVLQPFIHQKQVCSTIKDQSYCDYVVGTLLCFNDRFFGPGLFRTSSFEITNRVDDRKMAPCFTDEYFSYTNCFIL